MNNQFIKTYFVLKIAEFSIKTKIFID